MLATPKFARFYIINVAEQVDLHVAELRVFNFYMTFDFKVMSAI